MSRVQVNPGETLSMLSDRIFNGNVTRFTEILDLNPDLSVFDELPDSIELEIPDAAQIYNYAKPALSRIAQSVGGAGRYLSEAERLLNQVSSVVPNGYVREAIEAVQTVNQIRGQVEQTIDSVDEQLRSYEGQSVKLIDWLLGGR